MATTDQKYDSQARQVEALMKSAVWVVAGYIASVLTIGIVFKGDVPTPYLLAWVVLGILIHAIEFFIAIASHLQRGPLTNAFWKWAIHLGCISSGLYFASSLVFLLFTDDPVDVVVYVIVYSLVLASLFTGSAYYLTAYYLIVPTIAIPAFAAMFFFLGPGEAYFLVTAFLLVLGMHHFVTGFNGVFRNLISGQEKTEKLLQEVSDERDRANNAMLEKNNFLALASHDLRQPIHTIGLYLAAIEPHVNGEEGKKILDRLNVSTDTMGSLFNSILDISKLDAGMVEFNPESVDLEEICRSVMSECEVMAFNKGLSLELVSGNKIYVHADRLILRRVITNIVSNAIKYSEQGGVELHIHKETENAASLSIADEGIGIDPDDVDSIFSEFYQIDNYRHDKQYGLGLGLAIVKRLCELSGIGISVESEKHRGSTFTLNLPLTHQRPLVLENKPAAKLRDKQLSVLVIDDEPEILEAMTLLLEQARLRISTSESVEQARLTFNNSLLANEPPDLLIVDYRLKGSVSGLDLIAEFRNLYTKELPAILVTGDTAPELLQKFTQLDVKVLYKPVSLDSLVSTINNLSTGDSMTSMETGAWPVSRKPYSSGRRDGISQQFES